MLPQALGSWAGPASLQAAQAHGTGISALVHAIMDLLHYLGTSQYANLMPFMPYQIVQVMVMLQHHQFEYSCLHALLEHKDP